MKIMKNKFINAKKFKYYHHWCWTDMSNNQLKAVRKVDKAFHYKCKKVYIFEIIKNNGVSELERRKIFKKRYYSAPYIRKYNEPMLSPFGKRVKTRYNSFKSNWEVIYLNE